MKKTIMFFAALAAGVAGAEPGFIRAVFSHPGSGYDGNSDIWTADDTTVVLQPDVYAFSSPSAEETTYAYAAYMWCEENAAYAFRGQYDDHFSVKIDNVFIVAKNPSECAEGSGLVVFPNAAWHKIEIRCSNNKGAGGASSTYAYGGVWMKKGSGAFAKISDSGDGTLFRTDAPEGYEDYVAPESDFSFSLNSDGESVTLTWATDELKTIIVPDTYAGLPVTGIGDSVFQNHTTLQRVVLPETVTSIGNSAFAGCISLNTCNIPSGVTEIPYSCYSGCTRLHGVVLPAGLKSIGSYAFHNCSSLDKIDFPVALTSINYEAFSGCSSLKEAMLPDSVTSLGDDVFMYCSNLGKVHLPNGLKAIPGQIYWGCGNLFEVNIPNEVASIGYASFFLCQDLREIVVPATVTSVGSAAFDGVQRVVFLGRPPAGLPDARVSTAAYPKEYGELWQMQLSIAQTGGFVKENMPKVEVISATVRENAPTIMDVRFKVTSNKPTVRVRAIAFEDGVRSFANVARVETLVDNTGVNIGDSVAANVEHVISWNVAADLKTDLANIVVEVFAIEDDILPLELTTIPANGTNKAMELSWNLLTERQIFDALLWLYADKTAGLTLVNGTVKNGSTQLASGTGTSNPNAIRYIFSKMGYSTLTGDTLTYANSMSRMGLSPSGIRQYAYRWIEAQ